MQHQRQDLRTRSTAGLTDLSVPHRVISSAEIERHVARGKQMQAEAVAAFLRGTFGWTVSLFTRHPKAGPKVIREQPSRA